MPRMLRKRFDERGIMKALAREDRRNVATVLGVMLTEMLQLTCSFSGDFNPASIELEPYSVSNIQWVINQTAPMMQRNESAQRQADRFDPPRCAC